MLQKTFEITSAEEAGEIVGKLRAIPEVREAAQVLLQVVAFGYTHKETEALVRPIREGFPDITITGLSAYLLHEPEVTADEIFFDETPTIRLSFLFFAHQAFRLLSYEIEEKDPGEVVKKAREEFAQTPDLKGVMVTLAGFSLYTSRLMEQLTEGFEEIPFFGTMADVYYFTERESMPYVFSTDHVYTHGVIFLLYMGSELSVHASYIFGWKPIGKPMAVTVDEKELTIGDTAVSMIDGVKPEAIYRKYLGIGFDEYLTVNSCQFPLVVERDGVLIGRTPMMCTEDGSVVFVGSIRSGEKVRFSYTVPADLLKNTEEQSRALAEFHPDAVQLFICGNRSIVLGKEEQIEIDCFRRFAPETVHCNAAGEIYYHHGKGEFLNSALVAIGIREGVPGSSAAAKPNADLLPSHAGGMIPLSERLLNLLQAMSGDLIEYASDAKRANHAKSAFLANMSHEIRTPINTILGMDEMILRESAEPEIRSYASDIRVSGRTLLSLINDILDFSKIEEGRMEILPVQYELSSLLNDLIVMIRGRAQKKGLRFLVDVDRDVPHLLLGDEIRIKQIALNLLTNAVKYTEQGEIWLAVTYEKTSAEEILLRFSISDTGIGMKEEDLERLFSPFIRIEEKRNRSIEGTGLGMSIVKQLLSLMGSELQVESVYGEGSVFSFGIRQPVIRWEGIGNLAEHVQQESAEQAAYQELFHAPDARILVVDDTEVNLTVIQNLLKKTLIRVDTASSGRQALAAAKEMLYDVIFIDHMMPDMDGLETLEKLREEVQGELPVCIALTANAVSGAREMYLEAGFADYISKPVDGRRLEEVLKRYLPEEKVLAPTVGTKADALTPAKEEKQQILVVDDDEVILKTAEGVLGRDYRVLTCRKGTEAIRLAQKEQPALILLDINLVEMTGFEVLEGLRANPATRDLPVLFITADEDREKEAMGLKRGALDFIRKPFVPEVLLQRARRIILLDRYQKDLQGEVQRQTGRAERLTKEMMLALSQTVDAKDHYTNGHSGRVASYAAEIGRRMGRSFAEQRQLYEIGLLHDIGKIGVPEEIINKTDRLTDEEFAQIKKHTVIGHEILNRIEDLPELKLGARFHHERYDGKGYPDGLAGDAIPEVARIICMADCYDAMTSTRTYSDPKPQAVVRAEIVRCSGTQFDPVIAEIMLSMIDDDQDFIMNERGGGERIWKGYEQYLQSREADFDTKITPDTPADPSEESKEQVIPDWIHEISDLDTDSGIKNCGSRESFLNVLTVFHQTAKQKADEIETLFETMDLPGYTIRVHALKSAARIIGATDLSELARKLEAAGKEQDEAMIREETPELLKRYRSLDAALSPLDEDRGDRKELGESQRKEAFQAICEIAECMDYGMMEEVLRDLKEYRLSEADDAALRDLEEKLTQLDWDGIAKIARSAWSPSSDRISDIQ